MYILLTAFRGTLLARPILYCGARSENENGIHSCTIFTKYEGYN